MFARAAVWFCWLFTILLLIPASLPALSEVSQITITHREPWQQGKPLGGAGAYELLQRTIHYDVDPSTPANQAIADIALAPRNAHGKVEFSSDLSFSVHSTRPRPSLQCCSRY